LSAKGNLLGNVILKIVQRHIEGENLLDVTQFGFHANRSAALQIMRLADYVTHNFNNKMSMAAVFLDIEKAFDCMWHPGLLFKLEFSTNVIKPISSFPLHRKLRVSVEGEMFSPSDMQAGVPQGSFLIPPFPSSLG
jgi:hypothetical protein